MFDFSLDKVRTPVLELNADIRKRVLTPGKGFEHPAASSRGHRKVHQEVAMTTHILPASARAITRAPKLNLTRRGRFVFIGLPLITGAAALLVVAVIFLLPSTVQANTDPVGDPVTHSVTVQSDQSLWEIAHAADPQRDTREVMDDIVELNGLASSELSAGQLLEIPAR